MKPVIVQEAEKDGTTKFRTMNLRGGPGGKVIVATRPADAEKKFFVAGFAFCSPKDCFNRTRGKEIALYRLRGRPLTFERGDVKMTDQLRKAACEEAARLGVPWMKDVTPGDLV